jgi:hypothetical protein
MVYVEAAARPRRGTRDIKHLAPVAWIMRTHYRTLRRVVGAFATGGVMTQRTIRQSLLFTALSVAAVGAAAAPVYLD